MAPILHLHLYDRTTILYTAKQVDMTDRRKETKQFRDRQTDRQTERGIETRVRAEEVSLQHNKVIEFCSETEGIECNMLQEFLRIKS